MYDFNHLKTILQYLEKLFFVLFMVHHLEPILAFPHFVTHDGPAHLYNSQLINYLLFEKNTALNQYFEFNPNPVPNWAGHFINSIFNTFLPANQAEKMLQLVYMVMLPVSFRLLVKKLMPQNMVLSYLIFPFTYSHVFYMGFYNFSLSLILLILGLLTWVKIENATCNLKNFLKLSGLFIVMYFSHIYTFAILLGLMLFYILYNGLYRFWHGEKSIKPLFYDALRKGGFVILSAVIPLMLAFQHFLQRPVSNKKIYLGFSSLFDNLSDLGPLIGVNPTLETTYTKKILWVLIFLCFAVIVRRFLAYWNSDRIDSKNTQKKRASHLFHKNDFWLVCSFLMLIFYFLMPDGDDFAGYISIRNSLLFFLFLVIWLALQKTRIWLQYFAVGLLLTFSNQLNAIYLDVAESLNTVAIECRELSKNIAPNSTVLPINISDNWLHVHFSNYLGIDQPVVVLQNYECTLDYFPLKWNDSKIPNMLFGSITANQLPCLNWRGNVTNNPQPIDYVFVIGKRAFAAGTCEQIIAETLNAHYELIATTDYCKLYQLH